MTWTLQNWTQQTQTPSDILYPSIIQGLLSNSQRYIMSNTHSFFSLLILENIFSQFFPHPM